MWRIDGDADSLSVLVQARSLVAVVWTSEHSTVSCRWVAEFSSCMEILLVGTGACLLILDVDEFPYLAALHEVKAIPALHVYRDGCLRSKRIGARTVLQTRKLVSEMWL